MSNISKLRIVVLVIIFFIAINLIGFSQSVNADEISENEINEINELDKILNSQEVLSDSEGDSRIRGKIQ